MVSNVYDFKNGLEAQSYSKQLLALEFPEFEVIRISKVDMSRSKFGYFDISILYKDAKFNIECERGVLHYNCEIENQKIGLNHFDEGINDVLAFSKTNLKYTLSVFKRFVESLLDNTRA